MSVVTNVILTCDLQEDAAVAKMNSWLSAAGHGRLVDVSGVAGGEKSMEAGVWVAAFNYLQIGGFIEAVRECPWEHPENVRLFMQGENHGAFKEWPLR
jgi:hypothetical protein